MRPAALMRGAIRKATSPEVSGLPLSLRNLQQGLQPRIDRRAQAFESQLGEYAVLSTQRHRIGDGCDGRNLHERSQQLRLIAFRKRLSINACATLRQRPRRKAICRDIRIPADWD